MRDAADVPVLGTFLAAEADYLITGDQDPLALRDRHPILTPAEFWRRHGGGEDRQSAWNPVAPVVSPGKQKGAVTSVT